MAVTATIYHVDLTGGRIEKTTLGEDEYRRYPGGSALAVGLAAVAAPPRGLGSPWRLPPPTGHRLPRRLQLLWDARTARRVYPSWR